MRKFLLVALVFFVFTLYAQPVRVLFDDPDYYSRYAGDTECAKRYFQAQGFRSMTAPELLTFMQGPDIAGSVILCLSDITPSSWAIPYDRTSPLYQYCAKGGRYVVPAGSTFAFFIGKEDVAVTSFPPNKNCFLFKAFGILPIYGLRGKDSLVTETGKKWNLEKDFSAWADGLDLAIPSEYVTPLVSANNGKAALVWQKNINPGYPYSGLIGCCFKLRDYLPMLETIYRLCVFDGKELDVPKVSYAPESRRSAPVELTTCVNGIPRSVFERGETIPVQTIFNNGKKAWVLQVFDEHGKKLLETSGEMIDTSNFSSGKYLIRCVSDGSSVAEKTFTLVAKRKANTFPFMVWKNSRPHLAREEYAARFIAGLGMNQNIDDIHQMTNANHARLGNVIDHALLNHQLFSVRTSILSHYTADPSEKLILYDGKVHQHGIHESTSSRAVAASPDRIVRNLKAQIAAVEAANAPNFYPFVIVNDDGSMLGNFDFNPLTMTDFEGRTGLKKSDLPPLVKLKIGNNLFIPEVAPGIVPWNHPFLEYFRYHCANYNKIAAANVEGAGGKPVGDIGLMSGPLYVGRGFYPPLSHANYNTVCFYNYTFWYSAMTFNIEAARTAGRDKPLGVLTSGVYIPWGNIYQRGILYRILAEAPAFVGLYHLDDSNMALLKEQCESTWKGNREVAFRIAPASEFFKMQKISPRRGALLMSLAQMCFKIDHKNAYPYSMYSALENFRRAGFSLDVLSSEEIIAGKLKDYDVIFINDCQWLTDRVKKMLEQYISSGGHVVSDRQTTVRIEGAEQSSVPFGMGLSDIGQPETVAVCRQYAGKFVRNPLIAAEGGNTAVFVNAMPDQTPLIWILDCESNAELKANQSAMNKDWTRGLYRRLNEMAAGLPVQPCRLAVAKGWNIYDLFNHREIPVQNGKIELGLHRLDAAALLMLRDRVGSVSLKAVPATVRTGRTVDMNAVLLTPEGKPVSGTVPAEFTVMLDGKELWEYGGNSVFQNGKMSFRLPVAINAPQGDWRITVRELASGKVIHHKIQVTK